MKAVPERMTIGLEPVAGAEPDGLEVVFRGADATLTSGREYDLPAGKAGTWEFTVTVSSRVADGGGFLFQRRGFLLAQRTQDYNPMGRDYVTLDSGA